ncbi:MAG: divergent polysaccharide deacetylase family protein, partial [Pirellulales bacterium]|nr:divergent polysaccharide deacetylase family protein [Pirellulales bacterium]
MGGRLLFGAWVVVAAIFAFGLAWLLTGNEPVPSAGDSAPPAVTASIVDGSAVIAPIAPEAESPGSDTAGETPPPEKNDQTADTKPAEQPEKAPPESKPEPEKPAEAPDASTALTPEEKPTVEDNPQLAAVPDDNEADTDTSVAPTVAQPAFDPPVFPERAPRATPTVTSPRPGPLSSGLKSVDVALLESGPHGPLPIITTDGRRAWREYARPYAAAGSKPAIAIVISSLGLSRAATRAAIQQLPGPVTLSFAPYANRLDQWVNLARLAGHEVLIDLPMEPVGFPRNDPGPKALLTDLETRENLDRLSWVLSRTAGYVGVINHMGSRFTQSEEHLRPVLSALRNRGLMFVDSRSAPGSIAAGLASDLQLPRAFNDRFIDAEASRPAIDARLAELEDIATRRGIAVGVGFPFPVT